MKKFACLVTLAALGGGCSDIAKSVDAFTTVDLGRGELMTVEVDRSVMLGPDYIPLCIDISLTIPDTTTRVGLMNTTQGCALSLEQPDLELLDAESVQRAREQMGPFKVDGVKAGSIEIDSFQLSTIDGAALKLSDYVTHVSVQADGNTIAERLSATELEGTQKVKRDLPAPLIDKLKSALQNNQPANVDLLVTFWLNPNMLLPESIKLNLVLQPMIEVNVVDAL